MAGPRLHHDKNRNTVYFSSTSAETITEPPLLHISCQPAIGDVFVHDVANRGLQLWVLDKVDGQAQWERVYALDYRKHPCDSTLFLSFPTPTAGKSKREPTWVMESTAKRHRPNHPKVLVE